MTPQPDLLRRHPARLHGWRLLRTAIGVGWAAEHRTVFATAAGTAGPPTAGPPTAGPRSAGALTLASEALAVDTVLNSLLHVCLNLVSLLLGDLAICNCLVELDGLERNHRCNKIVTLVAA